MNQGDTKPESQLEVTLLFLVGESKGSVKRSSEKPIDFVFIYLHFEK